MSMSDVREAFTHQIAACRKLGSPLTAQICEILRDSLDINQGAVARTVLCWKGDPFSRADSVPLRLCGGLHALVLTGRDKTLAKSYADAKPTAEILLNSLIEHEKYLLEWLEGPPQTNEVGRAAVIIAAARFANGQYNLPIRALELGASAGLNLNFNHFHLLPQGTLLPSTPDGTDSSKISANVDGQVELRPDWYGELPVGALNVSEAEGVDLRPIDPVHDELRLLAYCWADQSERMNRLREAIKIAQAYPKQVAAWDAGAWLANRIALPVTEQLTFVYHTIAWQYFPPETQKICEDALHRAGAAATPTAPLAHFSMEGDGGEGAALTLRLWDGNQREWRLGRVDFHGRWVKWQPELI